MATLAERQTEELTCDLNSRLQTEGVLIKDLQGQIKKTILTDFLEQKSRMNHAIFTHFGSVNVIEKLFLVKIEYSCLLFGLMAGDGDNPTYQELYFKKKSFLTKESIKPNSGLFVLLGSLQ